MKDKIVITFESHGVKSEVSTTDQAGIDEVIEIIKVQLLMMGYTADDDDL